MSATPLDPKLRERAAEAANRLYEMTPTRVWVEGDGRIYGDFTGNAGQRKRLDELAIIKLLHEANQIANQLISVL